MKNKFFFAQSILVLLSVVLFMGCKSNKNAKQMEKVTFETLTQDDFGGPKKEGQFVVKTEAEAKALGAKKWPDLSKVNFETHSLLVVAFGEKPTGGFACTIKRVEMQGKALKVFYTEVMPGSETIVAQAFTQPWHVVKVPKAEGEVEFVKID